MQNRKCWVFINNTYCNQKATFTQESLAPQNLKTHPCLQCQCLLRQLYPGRLCGEGPCTAAFAAALLMTSQVFFTLCGFVPAPTCHTTPPFTKHHVSEIHSDYQQYMRQTHLHAFAPVLLRAKNVNPNCHSIRNSLTFARILGGLGKPTAFGGPSLTIEFCRCCTLCVLDNTSRTACCLFQDMCVLLPKQTTNQQWKCATLNPLSLTFKFVTADVQTSVLSNRHMSNIITCPTTVKPQSLHRNTYFIL